MSFCFLIFVLLVSCSTDGYEPALPPPTGTDVAEYVIPPQRTAEAEIQVYQEMLAQDNLTEAERLRIEGLLAESQKVATMIAALPPASMTEAAAAFHELETLVAEYTPPPTATRQLGILESGIFFEAHVPREVYIENIWQGYINGDFARIYAGRLRPDYRTAIAPNWPEETQHGAVYVMIFTADGSVQTGLYSADTETGPLRITEAKDDYLVLASTGTEELPGKVYYFDLANLQLTDSLDDLQTLP